MNYDVFCGRKKIKEEQNGQLILNRVGMVLTTQLNTNSSELAESLSSWDK